MLPTFTRATPHEVAHQATICSLTLTPPCGYAFDGADMILPSVNDTESDSRHSLTQYRSHVKNMDVSLHEYFLM